MIAKRPHLTMLINTNVVWTQGMGIFLQNRVKKIKSFRDEWSSKTGFHILKLYECCFLFQLDWEFTDADTFNNNFLPILKDLQTILLTCLDVNWYNATWNNYYSYWINVIWYKFLYLWYWKYYTSGALNCDIIVQYMYDNYLYITLYTGIIQAFQ